MPNDTFLASFKNPEKDYYRTKELLIFFFFLNFNITNTVKPDSACQVNITLDS